MKGEGEREKKVKGGNHVITAVIKPRAIRCLRLSPSPHRFRFISTSAQVLQQTAQQSDGSRPSRPFREENCAESTTHFCVFTRTVHAVSKVSHDLCRTHFTHFAICWLSVVDMLVTPLVSSPPPPTLTTPPFCCCCSYLFVLFWQDACCHAGVLSSIWS